MGPEWIVVAVVAVVVIFGVNKLPQIARNMGKAQSEFKKGLKEGGEEQGSGSASNSPPPPPPPVE
ncbi:MAG: twin-arginine translocase TatA/TatE family subunit [Planctomycetaceae bacterium]